MKALEVFPCGKCGKSFDYIYALKRHGKNCGANKPRKCRKCSKWFENHVAAGNHEILCFNDNTPLECVHCSKTFEHLYMLQRHYRCTHRIKMSALNKKPNRELGTFIECNFPANEERLQDTSQYVSSETDNSSVYTIEIEAVTDMPKVDPNEQTLIYKIRQTKNSAEVEVLPECVISDFDSIIQEDESNDGDPQAESLENIIEVDDGEEVNLFNEAEFYDIE